MKRYLLIATVLFFSIMLVSCDKNEERVETNQQNGDTEAVTVYICTGPKSKRYHNDNSCRGL